MSFNIYQTYRLYFLLCCWEINTSVLIDTQIIVYWLYNISGAKWKGPNQGGAQKARGWTKTMYLVGKYWMEALDDGKWSWDVRFIVLGHHFCRAIISTPNYHRETSLRWNVIKSATGMVWKGYRNTTCVNGILWHLVIPDYHTNSRSGDTPLSSSYPSQPSLPPHPFLSLLLKTGSLNAQNRARIFLITHLWARDLVPMFYLFPVCWGRNILPVWRKEQNLESWESLCVYFSAMEFRAGFCPPPTPW